MGAIQQVMASLGGAATVNIANLFKVNTRTGTGSAGSVTSALFKPDLVISKTRSGSVGWAWTTVDEGVGNYFDSSGTLGLVADAQAVTALNSNGFSFGTSSQVNTNGATNPATYVDFMAKKAIGFMDGGTATGNGTLTQTINHNLGFAPGMIIFFDASGTTEWVWHNTFGTSTKIALNTTSSSTTPAQATISSTSSTQFVMNPNQMLGSVSHAFQWIAFAHDTSASSKIYCGSVTTDGTGAATVSGLPFRPQFVLLKDTSGAEPWFVLDTTRGWVSGVGNSFRLSTNATTAEGSTGDMGGPTSNGFTLTTFYQASSTYIYMAINSV